MNITSTDPCGLVRESEIRRRRVATTTRKKRPAAAVRAHLPCRAQRSLRDRGGDHPFRGIEAPGLDRAEDRQAVCDFTLPPLDYSSLSNVGFRGNPAQGMTGMAKGGKIGNWPVAVGGRGLGLDYLSRSAIRTGQGRRPTHCCRWRKSGAAVRQGFLRQGELRARCPRR